VLLVVTTGAFFSIVGEEAEADRLMDGAIVVEGDEALSAVEDTTLILLSTASLLPTASTAIDVDGDVDVDVEDDADDTADEDDVGNGGNSILHILISVQFPAVAKQYLLLLLMLWMPLGVLLVGSNDKDIKAVGKPLLLASSQFHNICGISTFIV
jgi:hypothetical protein